MNVSEFKIWFGEGMCTTNDLFTALEVVRRNLSYVIERQAREGKCDVVETLAWVLGLKRFHDVVIDAGVRVGTEWVIEGDRIAEAWDGFTQGYDAVMGARIEIRNVLQYGPDRQGPARVRDLHIGPLLERIESQGFPV